MSDQPHAVPELKEPELPPTGPVLKVLAAIDNGLATVEKALIVVLTAFMLGAVGLQVVARLLNIGVPGAMEASVFAMLALSLVAGSVTTHYRRHITIDILSRVMPPPVRTSVSVVINLIGGVLMLYIARASWYFVELNRTGGEYNSPALKIPYWWIQFLLPIAFGIISFRFFLYFLEDGKRVITRKWLPPDSHHHGVDIRM